MMEIAIVVFLLLIGLLILAILYEAVQAKKYAEANELFMGALENVLEIVNTNAGVQKEATMHLRRQEEEIELFRMVQDVHSEALRIYAPALAQNLLESRIAVGTVHAEH